MGKSPSGAQCCFFVEAERNEGSVDNLLLMADDCVLNRSAPGHARSTGTSEVSTSSQSARQSRTQSGKPTGPLEYEQLSQSARQSRQGSTSPAGTGTADTHAARALSQVSKSIKTFTPGWRAHQVCTRHAKQDTQGVWAENIRTDPRKESRRC